MAIARWCGSSTAFKNRRKISEKGGNVAMIFALAVLPIFMMAGIAIDFRFASNSQDKAQYTLDQALLAATIEREQGKSKEEVQATFEAYFEKVYAAAGPPATCTTPTLQYVDDSYDMIAASSCTHPTTIYAAFGTDTINFDVTARSTYGIGKLDVAFVFDVSGSMAGTKLTDLRAAARSSVKTILPTDLVASGNIRIGMVSYSHFVNAGVYFPDVVESATYPVTTSGPAYLSWTPVDGETCVPKTVYFWGWYPVDVYECTAGTTVQVPYDTTCVSERTGTDKYTAKKPGTDAWLPIAVSYSRNGYWYPKSECPSQGPLPLTNSLTAIDNYITNLNAVGGTAGHQGVAWGWYLIDPDWAHVWPTSSEPLPYTEPDSTKVIILMTDGQFNATYAAGQGTSDEQARKICDEIHKNPEIVVFSVAFQAPEPGQKVLEYCATETENYFSASTSEQLQDAYDTIATAITDLRIKS